MWYSHKLMCISYTFGHIVIMYRLKTVNDLVKDQLSPNGVKGKGPSSN